MYKKIAILVFLLLFLSGCTTRPSKTSTETFKIDSIEKQNCQKEPSIAYQSTNESLYYVCIENVTIKYLDQSMMFLEKALKEQKFSLPLLLSSMEEIKKEALYTLYQQEDRYALVCNKESKKIYYYGTDILKDNTSLCQ